MRVHPTLIILLTLPLAACRAGSAPQDPGSPTPVTSPGPGRTVAATPQSSPTRRGTGEGKSQVIPVRANQAPLVRVLDALKVDSLLGRRVRVVGRCVAAGQGPRAGSWTLADSSATIEVRGLVPSSCAALDGDELTIFAQIEPISGNDRERLLLRLPD